MPVLMEGARIVIFDDQELIRQLLTDGLVHYGHDVVGEAESVSEALRVVDGLEPGDVDIALVDGNFSPLARGLGEGGIIAQLLRNKLGDSVRIINISQERGHIEGQDVAVPKDNLTALQADIDAYDPDASPEPKAT